MSCRSDTCSQTDSWTPVGVKDFWEPGEEAHFEYHCYRGHDSADAVLWYRSHQPVTVLRMHPENETEVMGWPVAERLDAGMPLAWQVEFPDGRQGTVMDDELYLSPEHFDPQGGPPPLSEIVEHDPEYGSWLKQQALRNVSHA